MKTIQRAITAFVRYPFSDELSLSARFFNIITGICAMFMLLNSVASPDDNLILFALFIVSVALIVLANKTKKYRLITILYIVLFAFMLIPYLFIKNEGISGGMVVYAVFGAVIISVLLDGKASVITLALYFASIVGLIALDFWNSENGMGIFVAFETPLVRYIDMAAAIIICSTGMAFLIRFIKYFYSREQNKAEAANRAKSVFLATMSHELRTPLNAIIGMATIAKNSMSEPEKVLSSVEHLLSSSKHLISIVNDMLDMAKIESGKLELVNEPFNVLDAYGAIAVMIEQRCLEKNIRFTTNISEQKDIDLVGDKLRINQILVNLLGNAIKFTPENGTVSFAVDIVEMTEHTVRYRLSVTDTGIGISEEQMARLFVPFEQADGKVAVTYGGTGLGLSISQKLVNIMGGEIKVESEVGAGSKFYFFLTLPKSTVPVAKRDKSAAAIDLSGKRALIADDIEINRFIIVEFLQATGMLIDEAENGQEAVRLFRDSAPGYYDMVFMDIQMPTLDGYEAARQIRATDRPDSDVPIFAMTANAYKEDVEAALAAGMNGHIAKPVSMDSLFAMLKKHIAPI